MSWGGCFSLLWCVGSSSRRRVFFTGTVPEVRQDNVPFLKKVLAGEKVAMLMCMHGFLLLCNKAEMNKFPSLHMAFLNFLEMFKGQKGQAQQRKRANIFGNWANT